VSPGNCEVLPTVAALPIALSTRAASRPSRCPTRAAVPQQRSRSLSLRPRDGRTRRQILSAERSEPTQPTKIRRRGIARSCSTRIDRSRQDFRSRHAGKALERAFTPTTSLRPMRTEVFPERLEGAAHLRVDGFRGNSEDVRNFAVRHALLSMQCKNHAAAFGKTRDCHTHRGNYFRRLELMIRGVGAAAKQFGSLPGALRYDPLMAKPAYRRIPNRREEICLHRVANVQCLTMLPHVQKRFLHQLLRYVSRAGKSIGEAAQSRMIFTEQRFECGCISGADCMHPPPLPQLTRYLRTFVTR
jgi:hypothetical protein